MKQSRLEKLYIAFLLGIFGGIVLHAPLSVGLGTLLPSYQLLIKSWKEILMLLLVPLAAYIITRRSLWRALLDDWISRLIIAYVGLHLLLTVTLWHGFAATAAGLLIDLRYVLFFSLVYVGVRMLPQYRRMFIVVGTIGACVVVGFAVVQLFLPPDFLKLLGYGKDTIQPYLTVDKNPDFIRINSTLRGPNPLGAYAGMVMGLIVAAWIKGIVVLRRHKIFAGVLASCSVVALWVSYSRSSLVAGVVTVGTVVFIALAKRLSRRVWISSLVVVGIMAGALLGLRGSDWVSNVILHENPNGGSNVSSNAGHVQSLQEGFDHLLHHPLGGGVGSTGSAALLGDAPLTVEDQYLFIAHEAGWVGLSIFAGLFGMIMWRLWQKRSDWLALGTFASGIGLTLIGLLLPVWADDTVSIVWWGLAAVVMGAEGKYGRKKQAK